MKRRGFLLAAVSSLLAVVCPQKVWPTYRPTRKTYTFTAPGKSWGNIYMVFYRGQCIEVLPGQQVKLEI